MLPTIPAPSVTPATQPRSPSVIAWSKFGTVGFDLYRAVVLEEERRRFRMQMKGQINAQ